MAQVSNRWEGGQIPMPPFVARHRHFRRPIDHRMLSACYLSPSSLGPVAGTGYFLGGHGGNERKREGGGCLPTAPTHRDVTSIQGGWHGG